MCINPGHSNYRYVHVKDLVIGYLKQRMVGKKL